MVDTNQIVDIIVTGNLNSFIVAIVILLIGLLAGRLAGNISFKILRELKINKVLRENFGIRMPIQQFVSKSINYIIIFIALVMALNQLGLSKIILYIILILILLTLVLFIIVAFKEFIPNVLASFWIYQKRIIKKGDEIEIKDVTGKVLEISLTEIKLETSDNEIVYIPNSLLLKEKIKKSKN